MKTKCNRLVSALLVCSVAFTTMMTSSCSFKKKENHISMGQWLMLVNETFGMYSYNTEEEPYKYVDSDSSYYETAQIAAAWEVIDSNESIDLDKTLTWEEALVSLVNAGHFLSSDSSNSEKIDYAVDNFDNSIRDYWMNREIDSEKAAELLLTAQEQWATLKFTENKQEIKYKEGVINFTGNDSNVENFSIDDITKEDNLVTIANHDDLSFEAGGVYIIPDLNNPFRAHAYKIESAELVDGKWVIRNSDEEVSLYDIAEDVQIQETVEADANNMILYDELGNVIETDSALSKVFSDKEYTASNMNCNPNDYSASNMSVSGGHTIPLNDKWDLDVKLSAASGSLSVSGKFKNKKNKAISHDISATVKDIKVTNDFDYSWFTLHSAKSVVDYTAELSYTFGLGTNIKDDVYAPTRNHFNQGERNYLNSVWKEKDSHGSNTIQYASKDLAEVKIGSVQIWSGGFVYVCMDVSFVVRFDGTFQIKLSNKGSKGVEYFNNNLRFIHVDDKDFDVNIQAKIEAMLGVGPCLYMIGISKPIVGFQFKFGVGATASLTLHLVDSENHLIDTSSGITDDISHAYSMVKWHPSLSVKEIKAIAEEQGCEYTTEKEGDLKLHCETCIDVQAYAIVRLGVTAYSVVGELLKGKVTLDIEIFGSKNAVFLKWHMEDPFTEDFTSNFGIGASASNVKCTKKFKPFDPKSDTETETETESEIMPSIGPAPSTIVQSDNININTEKISLMKGEDEVIVVTGLPEGYSVYDLKVKVDKPGIIEIDESAHFTAIASGDVTVTIYIENTKFEANCAVHVINDDPTNFEGIN